MYILITHHHALCSHQKSNSHFFKDKTKQMKVSCHMNLTEQEMFSKRKIKKTLKQS